MYGNGNATVQIANFILTETGTYQEQGLRPFEVNVTAEHIDGLRQATHGGTRLGISALQDVAGDLLRPSSMVEGVASISQGWRSRRFRFMMRVIEKHPFQMTGTTQRVYFGYTDHCDASINHLDPNMRVYFNSETTVVDNVRPTPNGPVVEARVVGANQIVSPMDMSGNAGVVSANYMAPTSYLMRPEDIFGMGQTMHVSRQLQESGQFGGDIQMVYDSRNMVGTGGAYKYSTRKDTSPTRYLSNTLNAYSHAVKESMLDSEGATTSDRDALYGEAQGHAANQDIHKCQFFAMLKDGAGFMERGYVTLADLTSLFPELNAGGTLTYSMNDGRSMRRVNQAEDSEHWRGSDHVTLAATTLGQVVPAIMMDNFIRSISFACTNGHGLGQYVIDIHAEGTRSVVDNLNMIPYLEEFKRRLVVDVLNVITHRNQIGFRLSMGSDLAGDSVIDIELDGEPLRRYVAPTFTDSLFSPVITQRQDLPAAMASDMLYLMENTIETHTPAQPQIITNAYQSGPTVTTNPFNDNLGTSDDYSKFL